MFMDPHRTVFVVYCSVFERGYGSKIVDLGMTYVLFLLPALRMYWRERIAGVMGFQLEFCIEMF